MTRIHLLKIQKALIRIGYEIWVGLIVKADEFHRTTQALAVLVDLLLPDLVS